MRLAAVGKRSELSESDDWTLSRPPLVLSQRALQPRDVGAARDGSAPREKSALEQGRIEIKAGDSGPVEKGRRAKKTEFAG